MSPKEAAQGGVGIQFAIGIVMVSTMDGNPKRRRKLQAAGAKYHEDVFKPKWAREAAVSQKAMETDIDAENAEYEHAHCRDDDAGPAEEPGKQRQRRQQMTKNKAD